MNKTCFITDEKSHTAQVYNENHAKINGAYFLRFWIKEARHAESIFAKKRYTSIIITRVKGPTRAALEVAHFGWSVF